MPEQRVLYVVDRHDWALGTYAREMADSLPMGWKGEAIAAPDISANPWAAWRTSRRSTVVHFLAPYMAVGFPWMALGRRAVVSLTAGTSIYPELIGLKFRQFVAVSETTASQARDLGLDVAHVCRLGGSPLLAPLAKARRAGRHRTASIPAIGYIGKVSSDSDGSKGLDVLVETMERLSTLVKFELLLCGEGWDEIADLMKSKGVLVRNLGFIPQVKDFYENVDIILCTSRLDGAPLSLIEGAVSGLPVVTTRVGVAPELVEPGRNGYICPVGDVDSLVGALQRLVADPLLLDQMTSRSAEIGPAAWHWGHDRDRVARLYEDTLKTPRYRGGIRLWESLSRMIYAMSRRRIRRILNRSSV